MPRDAPVTSAVKEDEGATTSVKARRAVSSNRMVPRWSGLSPTRWPACGRPKRVGDNPLHLERATSVRVQIDFSEVERVVPNPLAGVRAPEAGWGQPAPSRTGRLP